MQGKCSRTIDILIELHLSKIRKIGIFNFRMRSSEIQLCSATHQIGCFGDDTVVVRHHSSKIVHNIASPTKSRSLLYTDGLKSIGLL
jgi:hypothetical protein